jgi:hypothetical protein
MICRAFLRSILRSASTASEPLPTATTNTPADPPRGNGPFCRAFFPIMVAAVVAVGTFPTFTYGLLITPCVSFCRNAMPMHLAGDYIHPCKSAGGPARCRVRIYCQTTSETTSPPTGVILAWKATPSRSWSITSLRLRRVVPGAQWRGQPRRGSRHEHDYGKIGRGSCRRDGF